MRNETFRTKHFNVVTNSKHGACLLFDRKGMSIYQSQTLRDRLFFIKKNFSFGALNKMLSLAGQLKNMMDAQRPHLSLRSR